MEEMMLKIPKVDKINIRDYGIIKKADIKFKEGLNLIVGKNGTGKTTVIKYLEWLLNSMAHGEKTIFQINDMVSNTTILMDDVLCRLDKEKLIKALKILSDSKRQVILTHPEYCLKEIKNKIKANIINTKDFELNKNSRL